LGCDDENGGKKRGVVNKYNAEGRKWAKAINLDQRE